jgi:hypothetical protein
MYYWNIASHYGLTFEKNRLKVMPSRFSLTNLELEYPKLYILKTHKGYLLVEYTNQALLRRIRQGIHSKGPNRFIGHDWGEKESLGLTVWNFKNLDESQNRAIVGELVFLIREIHGKWPLLQQEINFYTGFPFAKIIAKNIMREQVLSFEEVRLKENKINEVFREGPGKWGYRGDPYLWIELEVMFENEAPTCIEDVEKLFYQFFEKAVGTPLNSEEESVFVKKYHGYGMSGGRVNLGFWREKGLPYLLDRFNTIYFN